MMKTYKIHCSWNVAGTMLVEADSLEDAERKAIDEMPLPEGEYLDDSFKLDKCVDDYGETV